MKKILLSIFAVAIHATVFCQKQTVADQIHAAATKLEPKTISWRRDFHEHPELGNREFRTAKIIADHLRSLGIEVREGVGKT